MKLLWSSYDKSDNYLETLMIFCLIEKLNIPAVRNKTSKKGKLCICAFNHKGTVTINND